MESVSKIVKKRKDISGEVYSVLKKMKFPINLPDISKEEMLKNSNMEVISLRPNIQYEKNLVNEKNDDFPRPIPNPANVHVVPCDLNFIDEVIFYCKKCYCVNLCKNGCFSN